MKLLISKHQYRRGIYLILFFGILICLVGLGTTGLVDETPPLFAAASRAMTITGDWLTPRVNGLPRFDKPPLVYWFMGMFYALPGNQIWDPLGTWAARLPSALSTLAMMVCLGDVVMRASPKEILLPRRTALVTSLVFALSPLVIIWSRIAVSDALLCSTLGISLILNWRSYVNPGAKSWWVAWIVLGLAVLTKGPVAIALTTIIFTIFGILQKDLVNVLRKISFIKGIFISLLVSLPWYLLELSIEGKPFWDSFFGYHNFQRLTTVVNSHSEPWWFFIALLLITSLPFTPFLIVGIFESMSFLTQRKLTSNENNQSLLNFAGSWIIGVFLLFTLAATKLPSYWLPATPAAALLIGLVATRRRQNDKPQRVAILISLILGLFLIILFLFTPIWVQYIDDPEMPSFGIELIRSRLYLRAAIIFSIFSIISAYIFYHRKFQSFIFLKFPLILLQLFVLLPVVKLADQLRQLPLRQAATLITNVSFENESIAMVGIKKPSLHFYTNKIILFESNDNVALVNLVERLSKEQRQGWEGVGIGSRYSSKSVLIVIDKMTSSYVHWKDLDPITLGEFGVYKVWRIDRKKLQSRYNDLIGSGVKPNWEDPKPERF